MHPAVRDQPERSALRRIVAQIDLDIMVSRHSLILTTPERIEIVSVASVDDARYVLSVVVYGTFDLARSCDGGDSELRRRDYERSEERRVGKECRSRWSLYH